MKYIFCLFFLAFQYNYGQKTIEIDENFTSKSVKSELSFYLDSLNIETQESIVDKKFQRYTKNFPGLMSSKFWFRLKIKNVTVTNQKLIYKINTVAFKDLSIYIKKHSELNEVFRFKEKMNKNLEIPVHLDANEILEFYFAVDFTKSIYFPVKIVTKVKGQKLSRHRDLTLGLFYGFTIMILLVNVFFYINTKNKFFLYYCFLLVSITLILAELDGLFFDVFGNTNLITHVAITLHLLLVVSLMLFTTKAICLNVYYPKLKYFGLSVIFANVLCFLIYVLTDNLLWYSIGEGFNAIALFLYLFAGILLFKRELYARFLVVGFMVIYISNVLYVLPSEFGLADIGFTDNYFKVGSVIEMIVFLYAISYRHKNVSLEKDKIYEDLVERIKLEELKNKSSEEIFKEFIKEYSLSLREKEIVELILLGDSNKQISEKLNIQETTVKYHISNLFRKTEISKRTELSFVYSKFKMGLAK